MLTGILLLAACSAEATPDRTPPPAGDLQPYRTRTPSPTLPPPTAVLAETPIPTPTPFAYTVAAGDTMLGIALRFGVTLEELMAANPEVSPSAMAVGQDLRIPSDPQNISGEPTPTPVPSTVSQARCYATVERGMWCLALVRNDYPDMLENISAQITLLDAGGQSLASQTVFTLLDILPQGEALPLAAFFPPDVPADAQPRVQMLTAIRLLPGDARYLPAILQNTLTLVDWPGRTAQVSGEVRLPAGSEAAGQVWVAATAYDADGNVVGVRRWDAGGGLEPGSRMKFGLTVASLGPAIERVELVVEARP